MTDYSKFNTKVKFDWRRAISLLVIAICLILTMFSCQAVHADELPIPVQTIIGECANCTDEGMIAVGNVLRNRARYRGQTVEQVALAPWQFSFWNDRVRAKNFIKNTPDLVVQRAMTAWQASATEDVTGGADHYFADYIKMPLWAKNMAFNGRHGKHLFYRS